MPPLPGTSKQSQQIQASLHAPPPVRSRPTQTLPASTRYRHTPDASMRSIRSSPIELFVAPLSTATHSMRSFIAPEQKHPLIRIRQGRLLDKLPPYVPRSMRFIQYTPKQSLLMRAVHYKSRRPLLNARLPTMPRSKSPFRRRTIQYACPEYPPMLCAPSNPESIPF